MTIYNEQLSQYITNLFAKEDPALQRSKEESRNYGLPEINIQPEEGRFLQILASICGAKKAVEIGTLGGYSGIWIARGLRPGGKLYTVEREAKHAEIAQAQFAAAGLHEKIEVKVGDAHDLLPGLREFGPYDLVFIDAEKSGYPMYFSWAVENIRIGGIIAAHNAFQGGKVAAPGESDPQTTQMRNFNQLAADDHRLLSTIYPAGDGTLVAVKLA